MYSVFCVMFLQFILFRFSFGWSWLHPFYDLSFDLICSNWKSTLSSLYLYLIFVSLSYIHTYTFVIKINNFVFVSNHSHIHQKQKRTNFTPSICSIIVIFDILFQFWYNFISSLLFQTLTTYLQISKNQQKSTRFKIPFSCNYKNKIYIFSFNPLLSVSF